MHCCIEGTFKWTFSLLIKRINCREPYYLGLKLKDIDYLLSKSKYPKEYPREQHEIKFFNNFLANELKTLLMYSSIYIFKMHLFDDYFEHITLYVLFIKILTFHMISCFPFEGSFKICHGLYFGTRAIAEKILKNINKEKLSQIKFFYRFQIKRIITLILRKIDQKKLRKMTSMV